MKKCSCNLRWILKHLCLSAVGVRTQMPWIPYNRVSHLDGVFFPFKIWILPEPYITNAITKTVALIIRIDITIIV